MNKEYIANLRQTSRKLIRELGIIQLNQPNQGKTPQHWHAIIEISRKAGITIRELSSLLILSPSATSRLAEFLLEKKLITHTEGVDKREKHLTLTAKGEEELRYIDEYSNLKLKGALEALSEEDKNNLLSSLEKYTAALENSRIERESISILTLSTSRLIRKKIIAMIENIQREEFNIAITPEINACILKAEESFYFNNKCNFWYAVDHTNEIIGSIGLKKIDNKNAEIKKFFVSSNYRGKGVAQKLMDKLFETSKKQGFKFLYLGTVDILKAAHNFYEKKGFVKITKTELPTKFDICHLDSVFYRKELG